MDSWRCKILKLEQQVEQEEVECCVELAGCCILLFAGLADGARYID